MGDAVAIVSLVAGSLCLLAYFLDLWQSHKAQPPAQVAQLTAQASALNFAGTTVTPADYATILTAIGKIGEALSKLTPGMVSLFAAVLFYANAMVASGALKSVPDTHTPAPRTAPSVTPTDNGAQNGAAPQEVQGNVSSNITS
jgi:hypothetical protein